MTRRDSCDSPIGRLFAAVGFCGMLWKERCGTIFESPKREVQFSVRRITTEEANRLDARLPRGVIVPCVYGDCDPPAQWCYLASREMRTGTVRATIALCSEHMNETAASLP